MKKLWWKLGSGAVGSIRFRTRPPSLQHRRCEEDKRICLEVFLSEYGHAIQLKTACKAYKNKDDLNPNYTTLVGYAKLVNETKDIAGQREIIANYWNENIFKPRYDLAKVMHEEMS